MKLQLTNAGKDVLLHAMEEPIAVVFTKIQYGTGSDAGVSASALSAFRMDIPITDKDRETNFMRLVCSFSNSEIDEGFRVTETGVFIQDPDDNTKPDILFAYGYVDEAEAIYIPSVTEYLFETTDSVLVYVGETENVTAILSDSMTNATKAELNAHIEDHTNPHQVTKEQVGLGNVPNVTTDGQTPTVPLLDDEITEETLDILELQNGNTMSQIIGKVANAIHWLITHIKNKNNPHNVTRAQIGAAATSHSHSASAITSGTLPVARGGTGVSTVEQLAALASAGVSSLTVSGSYTGNGNYGASNRVRINYPDGKKPKIVIVQPVDTTDSKYGGFICLADVTTISTGGICNDVNNGNSILQMTWSQTYLDWYNVNSATWQLNESGKAYRYLLIF